MSNDSSNNAHHLKNVQSYYCIHPLTYEKICNYN